MPDRAVKRSRVFANVGLDFFGPLTIKDENGESTAYGLILTCETSRAIHLELVRNVSTKQFLNALSRFMSRRGIPTSITSDNAPTFVLADKIINKWFSEVEQTDFEIAITMANKKIVWHRNTPNAPWQGGHYERLIRNVKECLKKTYRNAKMDYDTLHTTLIEIEACLNNRPLTYLTEDSSDWIRPADLLQARSTIVLPQRNESGGEHDPDYQQVRDKTREEVLEMLDNNQKHLDRFWETWSKEYLTSLKGTHKMTIGSRKGSKKIPKEGQVVLIMDGMQPKNMWKLRRITRIEGKHGLVIKTKEGTIQRPVNLVIPLEIASYSETDTTNQTNPDYSELSEPESSVLENSEMESVDYGLHEQMVSVLQTIATELGEIKNLLRQQVAPPQPQVLPSDSPIAEERATEPVDEPVMKMTGLDSYRIPKKNENERAIDRVKDEIKDKEAKQREIHRSLTVHAKEERECLYCRTKAHTSSTCLILKSMKLKVIDRESRCVGCLRKMTECRCKITDAVCVTCNERHHRSLCDHWVEGVVDRKGEEEILRKEVRRGWIELESLGYGEPGQAREKLKKEEDKKRGYPLSEPSRKRARVNQLRF